MSSVQDIVPARRGYFITGRWLYLELERARVYLDENAFIILVEASKAGFDQIRSVISDWNSFLKLSIKRGKWRTWVDDPRIRASKHAG